MLFASVSRCVVTVLVALVMGATTVTSQSQRPRDFAEFRGAWIHDADSSAGRIAALPVAKRIVIATTPTEFTVTKDSNPPETYRIDGSEVRLRDERTGVEFRQTHRFTLVAGMVALTSTSERSVAGGPASAGTGNRTLTTIITDAYSVIADTLTIERQHSVLTLPEGHLVTLSNLANNRMNMVYRRETPTR